jgi:hypothetical protein
MSETLHVEPPGEEGQGRSRSWIVWMGAATILIALIAVMWPGAERGRSARTREAHLPFGPAEQAYAPQLQIEDLELSRAENFLNQEVTTVAGHLTNAGDQPVANVEVTLEFADELGQIVLRESRQLFTTPGPLLSAHERRDFQIAFEHIPVTWNIQKPTVRVSGILFTSSKK